MLRNFCNEHWPTDFDRHSVLSEQVWPPMVYGLKDRLDRQIPGRAS